MDRLAGGLTVPPAGRPHQPSGEAPPGSDGSDRPLSTDPERQGLAPASRTFCSGPVSRAARPGACRDTEGGGRKQSASESVASERDPQEWGHTEEVGGAEVWKAYRSTRGPAESLSAAPLSWEAPMLLPAGSSPTTRDPAHPLCPGPSWARLCGHLPALRGTKSVTSPASSSSSQSSAAGRPGRAPA